MPVLYTNNALSNLSASITNSATSLSVTAGTGARFPNPGGSDYFYATITDTSGEIEIVRVTARSTDTMTVIRAQDGTTARAWSNNANFELRITRSMLDDFKDDTRFGYAPLNGTGASGTWGISISGNAATATNGVVTTGSYADPAWITSINYSKLTGTVPTWNQNTTGSAATLTTARTLTIGATGKTFNGSADVSWSRTEIQVPRATTTTNHGIETDESCVAYVSSISLLGQTDGALYSHVYSSAWKHQIFGDYRTGQIAIRGRNNGTWQAWRTVLDSSNYTSYSPSLTGSGASGSWGISITGSSASTTGNAATATALSSGQGNWSGTGVLGNVVGMLAWKNYGNGHVIFDASNGTTPSGTACSNSDAQVAWTATYPTLMGWNGNSTYGLRVDSARTANLASAKWQSAAIAGSQGSNVSAVEVRNNGGTGDSNLANITFHCQGQYGTSLHLRPDGYFGVGGWSASAWRWYVNLGNGDMVAAGNVTAYSDERLKKDWADLPADFVERLATVKHGVYTRIDSGERQAGSSAQQWQELLPEVVSVGADENKTLSLAYGNAALVSSIELAKRVVQLERELHVLKESLRE